MLERTIPSLITVTAALVWASCGDNPVEPTGPPGITILAGADVADSVDARPTQELVVEVRTSAGRLARHALVRFAGLPTDSGPYPRTTVRVGRIDEQPNRAVAVDTTDGSGRAGVVVALGSVAGPGGVEVTVPELEFADTARYTIQPGHAVDVVSQPADTVVYQQRSFMLRVSVRDRYGNGRSDPVTFVAESAAASVSPVGTVTSEEFGRALVRIGDAAGHADTTWVSVIPEGRIAATTPSGIVIVDLDGYNRRYVPGVAAATWLDWNLTGDALVFAAPDNDYSWLYVTTTTGPPHRLISASTGLLSEFWPQFSGDGRWIYFSGRTNYQNQEIWRVRSDGSSPGLVGPAAGYANLDADPAPSRDGSQVAYVSNRCCSPDWGLFLLHTQTGVIDSLSPGAVSPRWSPGDSLIAFVFDGVFVIRPDGQGLRRLSAPGQNYYQELDWSPTGEWVIARGPSGRLDLIRVADGLILTLPYFTNLDRPASQP